MDRKNSVSYFKIIIYLLIYLIISSVIIYFKFNKRYLIFNCGLSFIPYILTSYCANNKDRVLICTIITLIAIIFYPNALYMFTDLTHIRTSDYYTIVHGSVQYNMDYLTWIKLGAEVSMVTLSLILSYESFINILKTINCYEHIVAALIILVFFSVLTGIALYLGRFLRLNSWDIFKFKKIFNYLINNMDQNDYTLIGVFSGIHFIITLLFSNLKKD